MTISVDMGAGASGEAVTLDLEELLSTRLLVQGNSGSGKSHLLRRLLEQSARWVQQVVIDPEGDFVTLADRHGHLVLDAAEHTEAALSRAAELVRRHRVSVVLNLENVEVEEQLRCAAAFLAGLFEAERDCLVRRRWSWWTRRSSSPPPPAARCRTRRGGCRSAP